MKRFCILIAVCCTIGILFPGCGYIEKLKGRPFTKPTIPKHSVERANPFKSRNSMGKVNLTAKRKAAGEEEWNDADDHSSANVFAKKDFPPGVQVDHAFFYFVGFGFYPKKIQEQDQLKTFLAQDRLRQLNESIEHLESQNPDNPPAFLRMKIHVDALAEIAMLEDKFWINRVPHGIDAMVGSHNLGEMHLIFGEYQRFMGILGRCTSTESSSPYFGYSFVILGKLKEKGKEVPFTIRSTKAISFHVVPKNPPFVFSQNQVPRIHFGFEFLKWFEGFNLSAVPKTPDGSILIDSHTNKYELFQFEKNLSESMVLVQGNQGSP